MLWTEFPGIGVLVISSSTLLKVTSMSNNKECWKTIIPLVKLRAAAAAAIDIVQLIFFFIKHNSCL